MRIAVSVVVCTHNPREDYLSRVLSALASQTLPSKDWELIVIDNASASPVAERFDISWSPNAGHVYEAELGLTPARLRGIYVTTADLLVFVDDDNVVSSNYLEQALKISSEFPFLGAWGGQVIAEYESNPPDWILRDAWRLGVRALSRDTWSNDPGDWLARPFGAGLCVRRSVAEAFLASVSADKGKRLLGRRGEDLFSDEDHELVENCVKQSLGWGTFRDLLLFHLIPSERLTESYILRLIRGQTSSRYYRNFLNDPGTPLQRPTLIDGLRVIKEFLVRGRRSALFKYSELMGRYEALRLVQLLGAAKK